MDFRQLTAKVRSLTRDFTNSIFRENDIQDFINESIMRIKQVVPELRSMERLIAPDQKPSLLPEQYHHLLSIYAISRCFAQDERHYQATTYMNEFEVKLEEMKSLIEAGDLIIVDEDGKELVSDNFIDYVNLRPYHITETKRTFDEDDGVEGVVG